MCKVRFNAVTRLRDKHLKRFRARRRRATAVVIEEEEEDDPVAARAVCMHCGEGGAEDRLILCDGSGCGNVSREALSSIRIFSLFPCYLKNVPGIVPLFSAAYVLN